MPTPCWEQQVMGDGLGQGRGGSLHQRAPETFSMPLSAEEGLGSQAHPKGAAWPGQLGRRGREGRLACVGCGTQALLFSGQCRRASLATLWYQLNTSLTSSTSLSEP